MNVKKSTVKNRTSRQKEKILELLKSTDKHPTADWMFAKLKKQFPKLSLGTVYRNLSILYNQGIIKKIHFGSTFDRFEARTDMDYHLICKKCSNIIDFEMNIHDEINNKAKHNTDFEIHTHQIEFYGLCSLCKK